MEHATRHTGERNPWELRPLLVFWETTKACGLACKHCRAEAIEEPLPGELSLEESLQLVGQVAGFGHPPPILVITGGDPLMKKGLWRIVERAAELGLRVALAPSVTSLLTRSVVKKIAEAGVQGVSISLDSPYPEIHDRIRGVPGTWRRSVEVIRMFLEEGLHVQVNTVIMRDTVEGLADMVVLLKQLGVRTWEPFYLVPVGRAWTLMDLTPNEWEDVGHFLYEASKYGITIRTVEGPMFRRISILRRLAEERGKNPDELLKTGPLYRKLRQRLVEKLGPPKGEPLAQTTGTRDGSGIVFVAHDGTVTPSGFLPLPLGNVKEKSLPQIYRDNPLLRKIRNAEFKGRCGECEFREICGGSRARAYAYDGDPLGEDPACPYTPGSLPTFLESLGLTQEGFWKFVRELRRRSMAHVRGHGSKRG